MKYTKNVGMSGAWLKASEVENGTKAKLVSETVRSESQFKDKEGNAKTQDVAKIRVQNHPEPYNVSINRASLNGLIEAFGEESKDWCSQTLTIQTEKVVVAGKRVTVLYLVPEGFVLKENEEGYVNIVRANESAPATVPSVDLDNDESSPNEIPF